MNDPVEHSPGPEPTPVESASAAPSGLQRRWLPIGVGLILLTHLISLGHGFVDFDDDAIFLKHPLLTQTDWRAVLAGVFDLERPDDFRPMRDLSHWLDFMLHRHDPFWAHLHHLLWLGVAATLVGRFFRRLGHGGLVGLLALLLAFVHPVQVEVIGWISGRKDLLAAAAFFGAMLAFLRFMDRDAGRLWGLLAATLIAVGLMSKGHVIVAPGVMVALWWYQRFRASEPPLRPAREIGGLIGLVLIGCVLAIPRMMGGRVVLPESYQETLQFSLMWTDRAQIPLRYMLNLVAPTDLNHIYLSPALGPEHTAMTVAGLVLIAGVIGLGVWWAWRRDARAGLLAIIVGLMVPFLHFKPGVVYIADRYLFLVMPFVALLAVDGLGRLATRLSVTPRLRWAVAGVLVGALALASVGEHAAWRDSASLWTRMTVVYPQSDWGFDRLGRALYYEGRYAEAGGAWLAASERAPKKSKHLNNAAVAAMAMGENAAAVALLQRALRINPGDRQALGNLRKLGITPSAP